MTPTKKHRSPCLQSRLGDDGWNDATAANYRQTYDAEVPCTCPPCPPCGVCAGTGFTSGLYANVDRLATSAFQCRACGGTGAEPASNT